MTEPMVYLPFASNMYLLTIRSFPILGSFRGRGGLHVSHPASTPPVTVGARMPLGMNHGFTHEAPVGLSDASANPVAVTPTDFQPKTPAKNVESGWVTST